MSRRVFIIGAGSSAAFQGPKGNCPTISDFFIRAAQIGLLDKYKEQTMSRPLLDFVRQEFGINKADLRRVPVNSETVITRLEETIEYFDKHGRFKIKGTRRRNEKAVRTYGMRLQVTTFIGHVLLELTHNCLSPLHVKLADGLTDSDTVISFNYDLLMDYALEHTKKWLPNSGYRVAFKQVIEHDKFLPLITTSNPGIPYLKLHGSLNWLYGVNPYLFISNLKLPTGEDIFLLKSINHEIIPAPMDIAGKYEHTENGIYYDLFSLIVAPRKDKPYFSMPKALLSLWGLATNAMKMADELLLIGYSIPETDTKSRELIQQAKEAHPVVTLVDINPNPVIERLESLLNYKPSFVYNSFQDYVNTIKV